jgi:cell division septal protein FtsQ
MKGHSALPRVAFLLGLLVVAGGLAGAVWGRKLLVKIEFFNVRRVAVVGAHWVAPDSVLELAAIGSDRSAWDDYSSVERRLAEHPLIEEADVHRWGLRGLRIVIVEVEPLALVGVPALQAVRGDGTLLPIDPSRTSVDLPLLTMPAEVVEDSSRLSDGPALQALKAFAGLHALDPGLTAIVSDFELADEQGLLANLDGAQPAQRLALPLQVDESLVRRVRATLADLRSRGIAASVIEARYVGQIVVRRERV